MEHLPEGVDYIEIQFIAESLLGLYSMVAKYGGIVILYPDKDNVMRAYVPTREEFDKFVEEVLPNIEWADYEKLKEDIERVKKMLGEKEGF